ncbi:hypothetical protein LXL04_010697 [Taraxacum kok-saghyz]
MEKGFNGRYGLQPVTDEYLPLVSDQDDFNRYPWGRIVWVCLYKQLLRVFSKLEEHMHSGERKKKAPIKHKHTMHGFIHAFKKWILKVFPLCHSLGNKATNVIPHVVAWSKLRPLLMGDCARVIDARRIDNRPLKRLEPTPDERFVDWWSYNSTWMESHDLPQSPYTNTTSFTPSPYRSPRISPQRKHIKRYRKSSPSHPQILPHAPQPPLSNSTLLTLRGVEPIEKDQIIKQMQVELDECKRRLSLVEACLRKSRCSQQVEGHDNILKNNGTSLHIVDTIIDVYGSAFKSPIDIQVICD